MVFLLIREWTVNEKHSKHATVGVEGYWRNDITTKDNGGRFMVGQEVFLNFYAKSSKNA